MISQNITNTSVADFRERSKGKKVVLLYPWTNYRNIFLTHFLAAIDKGLLYHRITGSHELMETWLGEMVDELGSVVDGFGENLRQGLAAKASPEQLGEAFAADLAAVKQDEPLALFIDEFDRAPLNGPFRAFIRAAVQALEPGIQLAFSSRRLTYEPWYEMVAQGEALILGTEYRKDNVMFTVEDKIRPQLEIYSLGRGYAFVNGREITNWDGALPRNLFFYFVDHALVTRDEIFATFWPNLSVKEATNVFHVTKRKISERISMQIDDKKNYELTQVQRRLLYAQREGAAAL